MNSVLLSAAVAFVLALFAALIAPFFIDWNAYKHILEARLSEATSQPVTIGKIVELRILPTPLVKANGIRIGVREGEGNPPLIEAPRVAARIALAPFLSGEIRIDRIFMERPVLQVQLRRDGSLELPLFGAPGSKLDPERISLNGVEISEGSIIVHNEEFAEVGTLSGFNLTGEAVSLKGPFKAEGGLVAEGVRYGFRLATGRVRDDGALRTKLTLQPASGTIEVALDGLLSAADGHPVFAGALRVQQLAAPVEEDVRAAYRVENEIPWRANMEIEATPLAIAVKKLALSIGPDERVVQFSGSGRADFYPAVRLNAELQARRIDLDRALGYGPGGQAEFAELATIADGLTDLIRNFPVPVAMRLDAEAALINGSLAEDLEFVADIADATVEVKKLRVRLPGKTVLTGVGTMVLGGAAPLLEGETQLETRQAGLLLQWLGLEKLRAGALRIRPGAAAIVAKTRLNIRDGAMRLDGFEAQVDDSAITGRILYQSGAQRRIDLTLAVDALDLDRYFEIVSQDARNEGGGRDEDREAASEAASPPDIALRLNAKALTVRDVTMRALVADLGYSGGSLIVKSLSLGDLDGTSLAASGRIDDLFGRADGEIVASLTSEDLTGVARLAADLGFIGGDGASHAAQAAAISPAAGEVTLKAVRSDTGTEARATISAVLGGTMAKAQATFRGRLAEARDAMLEMAAEASNPDGEKLLAQFGLPAAVRSPAQTRSGRLRLKLTGALAKGADLSAEVGVLGVTGRVEGTLTAASEAAFSGGIKVETADARAMLRRLDAPGGDDSGPLAAEMSASIDRQGSRWRLHNIGGRAGGETFTGEVRLDLPQGTGGAMGLEGGLKFDSLSVSWLLASLLGGEGGVSAPDTWPQTPFDPSATRFFEGKLALGVGQLELPGGAIALNARFDLLLGPGSVALSNVRARLYGGEVTANLRLSESERDRGAKLSGNVKLKNANIERFAWAPTGAPVATGTVDFSAQIAGSGRSWLGLFSSLNGDGSFAAREGVLYGLDPEAFGNVLKAADSGLDLTQDRVREAFQGYLASGALGFERFEGVFEIKDGIVSSKNMTLESDDAGVRISTLVDLRALQLDSEWTLKPASSATKGVADVPPVALVFAGPVRAPRRHLDVKALTGYLGVRRLEQDVARFEAAQAEAIERERLDRLLDRQAEERKSAAREAERLERERQEAAQREAERQKAEQLEQQPREAEQRQQEPEAQAGEQTGAAPSGKPKPPQPVPSEQQTGSESLEKLVEEALRNSFAPGPPVVLSSPVTPPAVEPAVEPSDSSARSRSQSIRLPHPDPAE